MNTLNSTKTFRRAQPFISVVMPVFNEAAILDRLTREVQSGLAAANVEWEIIYVNDGSSDGSRELLNELANIHHRLRIVHLSRNFGHQAAIHAGLNIARGDATIVMDSDLQDDPRRLVDMIGTWRDGYDVVYAIREKRKESFWKRWLFDSFYRVLHRVSETRMPMDAGAFSLMDARVVQQVLSLGEVDRFLPGLRAWVGFRQTGIVIERCSRHDNEPRVSLRQLFRLAKTAIFGFSRVPLSMFYTIGLGSMGVSGACVGYALLSKWFTGMAIPGWASITSVAAFFGGLNAFGIAILGEYVVRIHDQVRNRPTFVVDRIVQSQADSLTVQEEQLLDSVSELQRAMNDSEHLHTKVKLSLK
jgi:polyisoprenyl-phosphate glycosyltransferase